VGYTLLSSRFDIVNEKDRGARLRANTAGLISEDFEWLVEVWNAYSGVNEVCY
jgi:hypothetical protein